MFFRQMVARERDAGKCDMLEAHLEYDLPKDQFLLASAIPWLDLYLRQRQLLQWE
jgi:hypothetical protein